MPQHSAFFIVQLSHLHIVTGKTIALTIETLVDKMISLFFNILSMFVMGFPSSLVGKESVCNAGDPGLIPGLGRYPGEGNSNPFQYSYLEISMYRGAGQATIHGITKS